MFSNCIAPARHRPTSVAAAMNSQKPAMVFNVRFGSLSTFRRFPRQVCFTPDSYQRSGHPKATTARLAPTRAPIDSSASARSRKTSGGEDIYFGTSATQSDGEPFSAANLRNLGIFKMITGE